MPSIDPKEIAIEIAKAIGNGVLGKGGGMLIQVQGAGPFRGARRAILYIKTNLERDYTIPKPSTFVKLRITPARWKGYLPTLLTVAAGHSIPSRDREGAVSRKPM